MKVKRSIEYCSAPKTCARCDKVIPAKSVVILFKGSGSKRRAPFHYECYFISQRLNVEMRVESGQELKGWSSIEKSDRDGVEASLRKLSNEDSSDSDSDSDSDSGSGSDSDSSDSESDSSGSESGKLKDGRGGKNEPKKEVLGRGDATDKKNESASEDGDSSNSSSSEDDHSASSDEDSSDDDSSDDDKRKDGRKSSSEGESSDDDDDDDDDDGVDSSDDDDDDDSSANDDAGAGSGIESEGDEAESADFLPLEDKASVAKREYAESSAELLKAVIPRGFNKVATEGVTWGKKLQSSEGVARDDKELWLFQIPPGMDPSELNGRSLSVSDERVALRPNGKGDTLRAAEELRCRDVANMFPARKGYELGKPFAKHIIVTRSVEVRNTQQDAIEAKEAVKQVANLKVRAHPIGVSGQALSGLSKHSRFQFSNEEGGPRVSVGSKRSRGGEENGGGRKRQKVGEVGSWFLEEEDEDAGNDKRSKKKSKKRKKDKERKKKRKKK